jgi:hypothetical protein
MIIILITIITIITVIIIIFTGEILRINPSRLQLLDVSENMLGDIGIASIAGAFTMDLSEIPPSSSSSVLVSLVTLVILDLSSNDFGDMGLLALCRGY